MFIFIYQSQSQSDADFIHRQRNSGINGNCVQYLFLIQNSTFRQTIRSYWSLRLPRRISCWKWILYFGRYRNKTVRRWDEAYEIKVFASTNSEKRYSHECEAQAQDWQIWICSEEKPDHALQPQELFSKMWWKSLSWKISIALLASFVRMSLPLSKI